MDVASRPHRPPANLHHQPLFPDPTPRSEAGTDVAFPNLPPSTPLGVQTEDHTSGEWENCGRDEPDYRRPAGPIFLPRVGRGLLLGACSPTNLAPFPRDRSQTTAAPGSAFSKRGRGGRRTVRESPRIGEEALAGMDPLEPGITTPLATGGVASRNSRQCPTLSAGSMFRRFGSGAALNLRSSAPRSAGGPRTRRCPRKWRG